MSMEAEATLDLGPLHIAIGNLSEEVKELKKRLTQLQVDMPVSYVGTCPTPSATFAMDLGGPNEGRWWQVRSIVIGGSDITQTPTGVGWVVVMNSAPSANPPLFATRDWTKAALPQVAFYGSHELIVEPQEELWVVITGGTAGVQYTANAMVEAFPQFVRGRL